MPGLSNGDFAFFPSTKSIQGSIHASGVDGSYNLLQCNSLEIPKSGMVQGRGRDIRPNRSLSNLALQGFWGGAEGIDLDLGAHPHFGCGGAPYFVWVAPPW